MTRCGRLEGFKTTAVIFRLAPNLRCNRACRRGRAQTSIFVCAHCTVGGIDLFGFYFCELLKLNPKPLHSIGVVLRYLLSVSSFDFVNGCAAIHSRDIKPFSGGMLRSVRIRTFRLSPLVRTVIAPATHEIGYSRQNQEFHYAGESDWQNRINAVHTFNSLSYQSIFSVSAL